ncbi:MAG: hypothetical protein WBB00_11100 [Mycobacterium sp.]|jgi:hypothetical protein
MSTADTRDETTAPQEYSSTELEAIFAESLAEVKPAWPLPDTSSSALAVTRELIDTSARRVDPPVRKSFVRPMTNPAAVAPLARVYSGGRSGVVAVKLYLALLWRCSAPPFETDKPARAWAAMLDLEDPEGKGARRIKQAMKALAEEKLIKITDQPGFPNLITLRDESGSGKLYELPSTAYTFAVKNKAKPDTLNSNMYFKVPQQLWRDGYIQCLSGPALVMLLILLAEKGGEGERVWFSTSEFPARYNISHKTRAAGTKELQAYGLLSVEAEALAGNSRSSTFDVKRRRKVYRLTPLAQNAPATAPPVRAKGGKPKSRRSTVA